jgi:alpha-tubulin suppressor-like RCC1 family protein
MFIQCDGSAWVMGDNDYGQLGDGTSSVDVPYRIVRPEQIIAGGVAATSAGLWHTLFLKSDGSLWGTGYNYFGELGDGTYTQTNRPEQIVAGNVAAIAAGGYFSLFLKRDGSLWATGYNGYGQLGDGTYNETNRPEQVVSSNVTAIAGGAQHSLFIKSDGSLWAMGYNPYGELGIGAFTTNSPYGIATPQQIVSSNVTAIAAGDYHSLFLKNDGSLWAMGRNDIGQLGDGSFSTNTPNGVSLPEQIVASNVTAIAAGTYHSLFLKSDGSLWGMGSAGSGQLGDGFTNAPYAVNVPQQIVAGGVKAIAAGHVHSLFLKIDGSLWAMGDNEYGQLGDGSFVTNAPYGISKPEQILAAPSGYNLLSAQRLNGGKILLSFVGSPGANFALDHSSSLTPPNWEPQITNSSDPCGALVFTNTPFAATNNFWRVRWVPR